MIRNKILEEDLQHIYDSFDEREKLQGANILVTGCAGFLGYYFMQFFARYSKELEISSITGLDNFMLGPAVWLERLQTQSSDVLSIKNFDIITDDISQVSGTENVDIIIHMASIASPTFYRKYPIETLDANIWGLRRLLEFYKETDRFTRDL